MLRNTAMAFAAAASLMLGVYTIVKASDYGWGSAHTLGFGAGAVVLMVAFVLREATMPVLSPGSSPLKVLHISDIHMRPGQRRSRRFFGKAGSDATSLGLGSVIIRTIVELHHGRLAIASRASDPAVPGTRMTIFFPREG